MPLINQDHQQTGPTQIDQVCHVVYLRRQQNYPLLQFQRQCEAALHQALGKILNHSVTEGLLQVTAKFSQIAREAYFRELHHKRSLSPAAKKKVNATQQLLSLFPFGEDVRTQTRRADSRWLRKMIFTFHRLVHLWLLRPLMRDDFLALCHTEGMDLSRRELDAIRKTGVLKPLIPVYGTAPYHVIQVFALSAIWPELSSHTLTERNRLGPTADKVIESLWDDLAWLDPDQCRLNGNCWLALTQAARQQRGMVGQQPAKRLWIEGRANLAAAFLFAIGIRPVAPAGRPRIAPDDIVLKVLDEVVLNYLRQKGTIRGCVSGVRRATFNVENRNKAMEFFRTQAPTYATLAERDDKFILSWREKLGAEKALDRAVDEIWASIDGMPDEEQSPGDMFAFERMASQRCVPLVAQHTSADILVEDVLQHTNCLVEGPARAVGCWDTHHWEWWIVPRWILRQPVGRWLLRHVRLPLAHVDATAALTLPDEYATKPEKDTPNFGN